MRVVEPDEGAALRWAALGAHVARGSPLDPDLLDRAAHGVRTVVVFLDAAPSGRDLLATVLGSEEAPPPSFRLVACMASPPAGALEAIERSGVDHVVLLSGARRWARRRRTASVGQLVAAIDAADDIAGEPRLVLDLGRAQDWAELGLVPP